MLQAEFDRTKRTLTLQDINTTPKELKTEQDCSHRQLFRCYCSSTVNGVTTRESSVKNCQNCLRT